MKGLLCTIMGTDCTNRGVTSGHRDALLIGDGIKGPFEPSNDTPTLVLEYDLNVTNYLNDYMIHYSKDELAAFPRGEFAIPAIQTLYNDLFAQGKESKQASLEVGCIVEVVDVDDLNHYMADAEDNTALIDTFTILREGSYAHYWSFDGGLKKLGITDGCCSVGVEFCKTADEYPQKQ